MLDFKKWGIFSDNPLGTIRARNEFEVLMYIFITVTFNQEL